MPDDHSSTQVEMFQHRGTSSTRPSNPTSGASPNERPKPRWSMAITAGRRPRAGGPGGQRSRGLRRDREATPSRARRRTRQHGCCHRPACRSRRYVPAETTSRPRPRRAWCRDGEQPAFVQRQQAHEGAGSQSTTRGPAKACRPGVGCAVPVGGHELADSVLDAVLDSGLYTVQMAAAPATNTTSRAARVRTAACTTVSVAVAPEDRRGGSLSSKEDGPDALSMRRLAQRLHVSPNALYTHVQSKADLIDGLVDEVYAGLDLRPSHVGPLDGSARCTQSGPPPTPARPPVRRAAGAATARARATRAPPR